MLFTDGATETTDQATYKKSLKDRAAAEQLIAGEGIILCGVFLNNNNVVKSDEVQGIVRRANGYSENVTVEQMGGRYIPITSASDLMKAYQEFYGLINPTKPAKFDKDTSFIIPGIGVTDVNISIVAHPNGKSSMEEIQNAIDQTVVTITKPGSGNNVMTPQEMSQIMSRGKSYAVYKINNPQTGKWYVHVETPDENVSVECSLIINVDIAAGLQTYVENDTYCKGQVFTVRANLYDNGVMVTDPAAYQEYSCTLQVVDTQTQEEMVYPMTLSEDGGFTVECSLPDYKAYHANVMFSCGNVVNISSEVAVWGVTNQTPCVVDYVDLLFVRGLFKSDQVQSVNLRGLVDDPEDDVEDIRYIFDWYGFDADAVEVQDGVLSIPYTKNLSSGEFSITFFDTQDASATTLITVDIQDHTMRDMGILVGTVIALIVVTVVIVYLSISCKRLEGQVTVTIPLVSPYNNDVLVDLCLDGTECQNKKLQKILSERKDFIVREAKFSYELRSGEDAQSAVNEFFTSNEKILAGVKITTGPRVSNGTDEDGRKLYAHKCRVVAKKDLLINEKSPCDLNNGGSVDIQLESTSRALELSFEI